MGLAFTLASVLAFARMSVALAVAPVFTLARMSLGFALTSVLAFTRVFLGRRIADCRSGILGSGFAPSAGRTEESHCRERGELL
jgi:hypothetical protein